VAGYKEVFQRPFLKVTALNTPDFPRSLLAAGTNMTITAELANGNVYYLSGAWMEGEPSIAAVEGTIALEFSGIQGSYAS
jgi:hypothetical protein